MISSQVIQKTLDELRAITRIDLCVMDIDGKVNSTTFAVENEDFGDTRL
jgi:carbohydrate diacid regulator